MRTVAALLLLASACFAQQTGRVAGRVVSSAGEPVSKATVRLVGSAAPGQQALSYVEVTSSDGRFTAENIAPGRYVATAQRTGYTPARNSAGVASQVTFEVSAGESKSGIEVRLTPLAVVSGTVTDADGDPVPNAQVRLVRYTFNQGRLVMNTNTATANGDDRGMFRLMNVQPGRYYVLSSGGTQPSTLNEIRGQSAREVNLPTYYPNAPDARAAIAITVGTAEVSNLNIRLRRGGTYTVKGTLVEPGGGAVNGQITVFAKGGDSPPPGISTQVRAPGIFQIAGLAAGDYTIVVRTTPARPEAPPPPITPGAAVAALRPQPAASAALSGRIDVSIGSADLENVSIQLSEGAEVTGRITVEDGIDLATLMAAFSNGNRATAAPNPIGGAGIAGVLPTAPQVRMPNVVLPALEGPSASVNGLVASDGTFRISRIPPLKRILQVTPLPPNAYVKSIRFGGQDVTRVPLDLSSGAGGALEIVISTKGAEITATPRDAKGELPTGGAPLSIWPRIPNPGSSTGDVRSFVAAGTVKAQGLAPGEYYVAAWETANADYQRVPEFLARFLPLATKVTVAEGESITAEPKLISREAMEKEISQFP